jgi:hypothetical protein
MRPIAQFWPTGARLAVTISMQFEAGDKRAPAYQSGLPGRVG